MHKRVLTWMVACALMVSAAPGFAAAEDEPKMGEMALDLIVARPLGIVVTALGAVAFVVSLPFSALGGNVGQAGKALVVDPGRTTFVRCLGCKSPGRSQYVAD